MNVTTFDIFYYVKLLYHKLQFSLPLVPGAWDRQNAVWRECETRKNANENTEIVLFTTIIHFGKLLLFTVCCWCTNSPFNSPLSLNLIENRCVSGWMDGWMCAMCMSLVVNSYQEICFTNKISIWFFDSLVIFDNQHNEVAQTWIDSDRKREQTNRIQFNLIQFINESIQFARTFLALLSLRLSEYNLHRTVHASIFIHRIL